MRHIKNLRIFENVDQKIYEEINEMIEKNPTIKGKIVANENTVFETDKYYLLIGDLKHIQEAHLDETIPGSKLKKGIEEKDIKDAIVSLVQKNKYNQLTKGWGPGEKEITDEREIEAKHKWLGLDSGKIVGYDNVQQLDVNSKEFKELKEYEYKDFRNNPIKIKVKEGEGKETSFLSYIGINIGIASDDKIVLSLVTFYPGETAANISDRNQFSKKGYYFLVKKDFLDKIPQNESLRHIRSYRNF